MACFNFEHLYQKAVDTMLIVIMVESLKYCQKLFENVYFESLVETLKSRWTELNGLVKIKCSITVSSDAGGL